VGSNWITRFLDRHPYLVSKFSSQFDKKRIKASNPGIIRDHFNKLLQLKRLYRITDATTYNMDEKGFRQGISDRAKVICLRRGRGMTGKLATDGNREMITVVEAISGEGIVQPPLVIYKGAGHYKGWYQSLKNPEVDCDQWKFTYSKKGWTSHMLGMEWIKHFHEVTKSTVMGGEWRLLIVDGHGSHITVEFVEFCLSVNIVAYCLPAHSTHLLQPLDVGLFSPLQKAYGIQVDRLVRFGNVAVTKGNFLPMLIIARTATYTKKNILGAWRGAGLIPFNPRHVLDKLTHGQAPTKARAPAPPSEPPTPRNTAELHRRVRQATLQLKSKQGEVNRVELAELIQQLEKFGIAADNDRELERRTLQQWQEAQKIKSQG